MSMVGLIDEKDSEVLRLQVTAEFSKLSAGMIFLQEQEWTSFKYLHCQGGLRRRDIITVINVNASMTA